MNLKDVWQRRRIDPRFRAESSLRLSMQINLIYFAYKAVAAICFRSAWIGASAFYYIVLCLARFHLLRSLRSGSRNRRYIRRKYRICGWMLLALTIAIGAIGGHSLLQGKRMYYPGHMIYAAATYTFYSMTMAIVNLVRYRRMRNPLYIAGNIFSLAGAMTAVFSLQCALIDRFGRDIQFQSTMNTLTGLLVFISTAAMAAYMILDKR